METLSKIFKKKERKDSNIYHILKLHYSTQNKNETNKTTKEKENEKINY